jgi:hypothetical protein
MTQQRTGTVTMIAVALAATAIACGESNAGGGASAEATRPTLTGCLLNGDEPGTYVLRIAAAADTATTGTAGSTPTPAGDWATGRIYRVVADKEDDLAKHVNTRVAINGRIENPAGSSGKPAEGATPGAVGSTGANGARADPLANMNELQVLRAESVRRVADHCQETAATSGNR